MVGHFHVLRHGSQLTFTWRVTDASSSTGFDHYATPASRHPHRLTQHTIAVHPSDNYRFQTTYSGRAVFHLRVLMAGGDALYLVAR